MESACAASCMVDRADSDFNPWICVCANGHKIHRKCALNLIKAAAHPEEGDEPRWSSLCCPLCRDETLGMLAGRIKKYVSRHLESQEGESSDTEWNPEEEDDEIMLSPPDLSPGPARRSRPAPNPTPTAATTTTTTTNNNNDADQFARESAENILRNLFGGPARTASNHNEGTQVAAPLTPRFSAPHLQLNVHGNLNINCAQSVRPVTRQKYYVNLGDVSDSDDDQPPPSTRRRF